MFAKIAPDEQLFAKILAALQRHKKFAKWTKDGGEYIPHPTTWLNGRRWEDELEPNAPPAARSATVADHERNGMF